MVPIVPDTEWPEAKSFSRAIAPWSTRSREGAPVAMPVSWDELMTARAANAYSITEAVLRAQGDDAWPDYFKVRQSLTTAMDALLEWMSQQVCRSHALR